MPSRFLLTLLLGVSVLAPGPVLAVPASLDERRAVELFLATSPEVAAARQQVEIARAGVVAAGVWPNPTLDLEREQVFSAGGPAERNRLGVSWPWQVGGKRELRQAAARAGVVAAEARARRRIFLLSQDLRLAFATAAAAEGRARLYREHLASFERLERVVETRAQAGESAGLDLMRLQLAKAEIEARHSEALANAQEARARLAGLMGQALEPPLLPARPAHVPQPATLVELAIDSRADLAALVAEREQAEQALALAERARWPDPALAAGLLQTNEPTVQGLGYVGGVSWPVPVLDRGQAQRARAEAELAAVEAAIAATTTRLRAEVPIYREALAVRQAFAERFDREVLNQVPTVLRVAELAYREGDRGIDSLLNAHGAALQARLRRLDLQRAAATTRLELERLLGARLTDR